MHNYDPGHNLLSRFMLGPSVDGRVSAGIMSQYLLWVYVDH